LEYFQKAFAAIKRVCRFFQSFNRPRRSSRHDVRERGEPLA
jgi:hypothetical protein